MEENKSKKELKTQYKERKRTDGAFVVMNTAANKLLLCITADLQGSRNRFEFAQNANTCVDLELQKDWKEQGRSVFVFEALEELEKKETQTDDEFNNDIKILRKL